MSGSKSISQRLISGSASAAAGKLITAASALGINAILARILTPEEMGAYFLIFSIVFVGALLSQLGVHQAIVKLIAASYQIKYPDTSRMSIKAAFLIVLVGVLMISGGYVFGFGKWLAENIFESDLVGNVVVITALWILLRAYQTLISQTFRGFHQIFYATIFEGAMTGVLLVSVLFIIYLLIGDSSLQQVILITLASLFITIIIGGFKLLNFYKKTMFVEGIDFKGTLKISLPLFLATAAVPCVAEMHIWILGAISTEDDVAIYGAAFRVAKFVIIPLLIVNSVIPPMIAQLMARGESNKVEEVLRTTAVIAGIPSIVIVLVLGLFSTDVMRLIYGGFYGSGGFILLILLSAQAINSLTGSPGVLLMMSGHQSIVMKFALLSGICGVLLTYILVFQYGGLGVSIGVATGMVMHNLGMWMYAKYRMNIRTHMGISYLLKAKYLICKNVLNKK